MLAMQLPPVCQGLVVVSGSFLLSVELCCSPPFSAVPENVLVAAVGMCQGWTSKFCCVSAGQDGTPV